MKTLNTHLVATVLEVGALLELERLEGVGVVALLAEHAAPRVAAGLAARRLRPRLHLHEGVAALVPAAHLVHARCVEQARHLATTVTVLIKVRFSDSTRQPFCLGGYSRTRA